MNMVLSLLVDSITDPLGKLIVVGPSHATLDRDAHPHDVVGIGAYRGIPSIYFQPLARIPLARMANAAGVLEHQRQARDVATRSENAHAGYGAPRNTEYVFTRRQLPCDAGPGEVLRGGGEPGQIDDRLVEAAYDFRIWSTNNLWQIPEPDESDTEDEIPPPSDDDDSTSSSASDDER
jgi:hypothetical protein